MRSYPQILLFALAASSACAKRSGQRPLAFQKIQLDTAYRAEGVAVFDVDHDGRVDLVTDQYWYQGPRFTPHEVRAPQLYDPATGYSLSRALYGMDVNHDGFTDLIVIEGPGEKVEWFENPAGADQHWPIHLLYRAADLETPRFEDLFGDGRRELLLGVAPEQLLGWLAPDADPNAPWMLHAVSGPGLPEIQPTQHGLGVGDVNADGRRDLLLSDGWFEAPAGAERAAPPWAWHPVSFAPNDCSQLHVYDVNGDGRPDVISASPHDYGVWWWEQRADGSFAQHVIDTSISEMHALQLADLDGDGVPEIVSGKRYFSHGPSGTGAFDPAVLAYYELSRSGGAGGAVTWVRHDIDNDSGVGTEFAIADVNGDNKLDIVVSNKKGLFVFTQR